MRSRSLTLRRRQRGTALLWFLIVALPGIFFGMSLAIDAARIVTAGREVTNAAEAAAVAGAHQTRPDTIVLDRPAARDTAIRAAREAEAVGATRRSTLTAVVAAANDSTVSVTIDYEIDDLIVLPLLAAIVVGDGGTTYTDSVTRTADVCVPGAYAATDGHCSRPRQWNN